MSILNYYAYATEIIFSTNCNLVLICNFSQFIQFHLDSISLHHLNIKLDTLDTLFLFCLKNQGSLNKESSLYPNESILIRKS